MSSNFCEPEGRRKRAAILPIKDAIPHIFRYTRAGKEDVKISWRYFYVYEIK